MAKKKKKQRPIYKRGGSNRTKNKKGQAIGLAVIMAIMIFIIGMLFVNFLKGEITRSRNSDNLDCSNSAVISDGTKLTCLVVDSAIPYFIVIVFSMAGGLITSKFAI